VVVQVIIQGELESLEDLVVEQVLVDQVKPEEQEIHLP
tara:strand:- start:436 stop:549 length:114 start_codon:yes stop_codon:yes gene_type:complete